MHPLLSIDIGAGTTDMLVFYPDTQEYYKAVSVSPIKKIAETILATQGDLLLSGTIMGGGAVSNAVIQHVKTHKVFMTQAAAKTIYDDLEKVREKGITIISEVEKEELPRDNITHLIFRDISPSGLRVLLNELGVAWEFSFIAAAVQDHGVAPSGVSSLDFRHRMMKAIIEKSLFRKLFFLGLKKFLLTSRE